jgi:hypothetical protein
VQQVVKVLLDLLARKVQQVFPEYLQGKAELVLLG